MILELHVNGKLVDFIDVMNLDTRYIHLFIRELLDKNVTEGDNWQVWGVAKSQANTHNDETII